jgi:hypothetical protein
VKTACATNNALKVDSLLEDLPRLFYVGQPSVSPTRAGSMILYRLLQNYPSDNLFIVESNTAPSRLDARLPGVRYEVLKEGQNGLISARFALTHLSYRYLTAPLRARRLVKIARKFNAEAILTVFEGTIWVTAARLAYRMSLPLHLIVHDDWSQGNYIPRFVRPRISREFERLYRSACSRLCVSPSMAEAYENRFGLPGSVLYPPQDANTREVTIPHRNGDTGTKSVVFAYAGSIYDGYWQLLALLAEVLESFNGKLLVYSNATENMIREYGLKRENVSFRPTVACSDLIKSLREEADALVLTMSFKAQYRNEMSLAFPSKIADYTATGLPMLVCGPPWSSIVKWVKANPGSAALVDKDDRPTMLNAVEKLVGNREYRNFLARRAVEYGRVYFSHSTVIDQFFRSLIQPKNTGF